MKRHTFCCRSQVLILEVGMRWLLSVDTVQPSRRRVWIGSKWEMHDLWSLPALNVLNVKINEEEQSGFQQDP